jgi:uncharacterized protein YmfQ (DUF2313 family)
MELEDYTNLLKKLLPPGLAWNKDYDSNIHLLMTAFAEEYARLDADTQNFLKEINPLEANQLLPEWERVTGILMGCASNYLSSQSKREAIKRKLAFRGGASEQFLIDVAASLGFPIKIQEFGTFRAGISRAGDHATGEEWAYALKIRAPEQTARFFRAGISSAGDPLREFANQLLQCVLEHYLPAHATAFYVFDILKPELKVDFSSVSEGLAQVQLTKRLAADFEAMSEFINQRKVFLRADVTSASSSTCDDPTLTPPWNPSGISSLKLWLDATRGITAAANKVNYWEDQSSANNDYDGIGESFSSRPTTGLTQYNGKNVVVFDGIDDYVKIADAVDLDADSNLEIFALLEVQDQSRKQTIITKNNYSLVQEDTWYSLSLMQDNIYGASDLLRHGGSLTTPNKTDNFKNVAMCVYQSSLLWYVNGLRRVHLGSFSETLLTGYSGGNIYWMLPFKGKLIICSNGNTLYEFDGNNFTLIGSIYQYGYSGPTVTNVCSACVFNDKIYMNGSSHIAIWDGFFYQAVAKTQQGNGLLCTFLKDNLFVSSGSHIMRFDANIANEAVFTDALPSSRFVKSSCIFEDKILIGTGGSASSVVYSVDNSFASGTLPVFATPNAGNNGTYIAEIFTFNDKLYLLNWGDSGQTGAYNEIMEYNPVNGTFVTVTANTTNPAAGLAIWDGAVYFTRERKEFSPIINLSRAGIGKAAYTQDPSATVPNSDIPLAGIVSARHDGTNVTVQVNANDQNQRLYNNASISNNSKPVIIGKGFSGMHAIQSQQDHFKGKLAEILVFTDSLSLADRQKVEGHLSWKWTGDGSLLPTGHPYKDSIPV